MKSIKYHHIYEVHYWNRFFVEDVFWLEKKSTVSFSALGHQWARTICEPHSLVHQRQYVHCYCHRCHMYSYSYKQSRIILNVRRHGLRCLKTTTSNLNSINICLSFFALPKSTSFQIISMLLNKWNISARSCHKPTTTDTLIFCTQAKLDKISNNCMIPLLSWVHNLH